jgi:2EXR family
MNRPHEALPMAATSFPRFSSLPPEIRRMIWHAAVFPRIVHLEMVEEDSHKCSRVWSETSIDGPESMGFFDLDHQSEAARHGQGPHPYERFRTRSIPPLFLVCKESHLVAEKLYKKAFRTEYTFPSTLFNFEHDILYLVSPSRSNASYFVRLASYLLSRCFSEIRYSQDTVSTPKL